MCGIAGIYSNASGAPVSTDELQRMLGTMPYRGPDAQGVVLPNAGVGIGHLRLSILDLSEGGNQPFVSPDDRYFLTFNGEIFNYVELRSELGALGHRFRTSCDTEVLLAAYAQWGTDCSSRFNGMWAFAIYDAREDTLFCSRDRFGAKPLYYAQSRQRLLVASEIKAILAVAPELATPNYDMLSVFLRAGFHSETSATFFQSIRRLEPAHNMLATRGGIRVWRYWDFPADVDDSTPGEAAEAVRALLTDAIKLRLRSDVPVGTSLSAGLDSTTIACLLRTVESGPHRTYTASFPGARFDEAPRAQALAESLGMESRVVPVEESSVPVILREAVSHLESPTQCPAIIPLWNIMQTMKGEVKVGLDGQGADELFGGYIDRVFASSLSDSVRRRQYRAASSDFRQHVQTWGWWTAVAWSFRDIVPNAHRMYRRYRRDEGLYIGPLRGGPDRVPARAHDGGQLDPINRVLRAQHEGGLRTLLQYGDAISMAHSIEVRMPYLDYRLVECVSRMRGGLKVEGAQGKVVLRNAVKDVVPHDILATRRKLGFAVPISQWFRDHSGSMVEPVLFTDACAWRGLFDPVKLRNLVERHKSGDADLASQILRWITVELWFARFVD